MGNFIYELAQISIGYLCHTGESCSNMVFWDHLEADLSSRPEIMLKYDIDFTMDIPDSIPIELGGLTHKKLASIGSLWAELCRNGLKMASKWHLDVDLKACGSTNSVPRKMIGTRAISCHLGIK